MKVIILAGGLGSRLPEYTKLIPKPMVKIGKIPIIVHIMSIMQRMDPKNLFLLQVIKKRNF